MAELEMGQYDCRKYAKPCFRKSYRNACINAVQLNFNKLNSPCRQKRRKTFWNKVRQVRNPVYTNYNCITCTTESLENYFAQKFAYNNENDTQAGHFFWSSFCSI